MNSFDILSRSTPLQHRLFLEASAGTGKTFTIEHLVVRLLLETELTLEQILVVTFTRAATRELKERIRANLEKIVSGQLNFDYLSNISSEQRAKIRDALATFDQAQIFTIHGFCHRLLQEFAFEAFVGLELKEWERSEETWAATEFLRTFKGLTPQQLRRLFGLFRNDSERLLNTLVDSSEGTFSPTAQELLDTANHNLLKLPPFSVMEAFAELRPHYKGMTPPQFDQQAELLHGALQRKKLLLQEWDALIGEDKLWLEGVHFGNLKVRSQYPGHPQVEQLREALFPFLERARHPRKILKVLTYQWHQHRSHLCRLYEKVSPDALLKMVQERLTHPSFTTEIRKKYHAVIVDEFQDTDPIQWEIFETLFLKDPKKAVYLVGDPKQSIYAFRKADIYTFLSAAEQFEPHQKAALTTNYRSTEGLIQSLNRLFCTEPWLHLPRLDQTLFVPPVIAARSGQGHLCFMRVHAEKGSGKHWPTPDMEQKWIFPFIVHEMHQKNLDPSQVAILVKDRYQALRVKHYLEKWKIPSVLYRSKSLGDSLLIPLLTEVVEALRGSLSSLKKVLLGPFVRMPIVEMTDEKVFMAKAVFADLANLWNSEGFSACIAQFLRTYSVLIDDDLMLILEKISYIPDPSQMGPALERLRLQESDERISAHPSGVQILTTHASKGLEFETVFALGVAARTLPEDLPQDQLEELDAEKLRQWYVALTRAKHRLYIPFPQESQEKPLELGEASPLEVFWNKAKPDLHAFTHVDLNSFSFHLQPYQEKSPSLCIPTPPSSQIFKPLFIQSFSSLARPLEVKKVAPDDLLPPGPETGVIVHRILERLKELPQSISQEIEGTHLEGYENTIFQLIQRLLDLPLKGFCLRDISWKKTIPEMGFLFPTPSTFLKGFIDLCFEHEGVYYLVDWKTNLLEDYSPPSLQRAMMDHDYLLQGKIYGAALTRYLKLYDSPPFGGVFFIFVRGPAAYHFIPEDVYVATTL